MSLHHGLRTVSGTISTDPYFKNTVLLLRGDGTNGGQNNTFLDDSSNNFTITRYGNTTQGTFSPFGYNWSNYFDGSGDDLRLSSSSAFSIGTGDFTFEAWINPANWTNTAVPFFVVTATGGLWIGKNGSNFVVRAFNVADQLTYSTMPTVGTWTHIIAVRSGTTLSLYYDGSRVATTTNSYSFAQGGLAIGSDADSYSTAYYTGHLSNVRLVKGTAVYDPTQTTLSVPTAPLTAITNTSLLTCQSNRFIDNSSNAFAITRNGDARVTNFAPFATGSEYSTGTNGGSGYFDGNGDNLTAADNAAFEFGSGSFSVDCWVYISSLKGYQAFVSKPGATDGNGWNLYLESNNTFHFIAGTGGSWTINIGPTVAVAGQWYHVCITRDTSNQWRLFLNGKLDATTNNSFSQPDLAYPLYVGKYPNFPSYSSAKDYGGYMSSLRIVKGGMPSLFDTSTTTVGTQVFTPPTGPYTGSESLTAGSVSLLLNFTNGGIVDLTHCNNLETVGNAQVSTSVRKYGTGSVSFDGTDDWLQFPHMPFYNLTGDFTIECWVYLNTTTGRQNLFYKSDNNATGIAVALNNASAGQVSLYAGTGASWGVAINASSSITAGAWYHLAFTRSGSTWTIWINGVSSGSTTNTLTPLSTTTPLRIGIFRTAEKQPLNGYLDDYRVTAGVCRYSSNFTPPVRQLSAR